MDKSGVVPVGGFDASLKCDELPTSRAVKSALRSIRESFTEDRLAHLRQELVVIKKTKSNKTTDDPYALLTREIKPVSLRNIDDITKEAKIIYGLSSEKKKSWAKVKAKARPRNPYTVLIKEIKEEGDKKRLEEEEAKSENCFIRRPFSAQQASSYSSHYLQNHLDDRPKTAMADLPSLSYADNATARDTLGPMLSSVMGADAQFYTFEAAGNYDSRSPSPSHASVSSSKSESAATNMNVARQSSVRMAPLTRQSSSRITPLGRQSVSAGAAESMPGAAGFGGGSGISRKLSRQASRSGSIFGLGGMMEESRKSVVEKMRSELVERRAAEMKEKEEERERRQAARSEEMLKTDFQAMWIALIHRMTRTGLLVMRLNQVRDEAQAKAELHMANVAAKTLQGWWKYKPLDLKLKRNPAVAKAVRIFTAIVWCKRERARRRDAAALLATFIQDSVNVSLFARRIYLFRLRIIKIQRWVRQWLDIQYARMQLLWLAMEKIQKKKVRQMRSEKKRNEKSSLDAMYANTGFRQTLSEIDNISHGLKKMLLKQEKTMQRVLSDQRREDHEAAVAHSEAEEALKMKKPSSRSSSAAVKQTSTKVSRVSSMAPINNNILNIINAATNTNASATNVVKAFHSYPYKHLAWVKKMSRTNTNAQRMTILRSILTAQRHRHCYSILELDRQRRIGGMDHVDVEELKLFLRDPQSSMNIYSNIQLEDGGGGGGGSHGRLAREQFFLLLTKGGLDMIEASSFPRQVAFDPIAQK